MVKKSKTPPKDNKRKNDNPVVSPKKKSKLDSTASSNTYAKDDHLSDIKSNESQSGMKSPDAVDTLLNLKQTVSTRSMDNDNVVLAMDNDNEVLTNKINTPLKKKIIVKLT
jgi:hypothetical protein